jgi:hypothetical protein
VFVGADEPLQTVRGGGVRAVPGFVLAGRDGRSGRRRARSRDSGAPPPACDSEPAREAAAVHDRRPGVLGGGESSAAAGAMVMLRGEPVDASPLAPGASAGTAARSSPRASPASRRNRQLDRSSREGEPRLGVHAHSGRTARDRGARVGHDRRQRPSPLRSRAGAAADRPHLVAVSSRPSTQPAGWRYGSWPRRRLPRHSRGRRLRGTSSRRSGRSSPQSLPGRPGRAAAGCPARARPEPRGAAAHSDRNSRQALPAVVASNARSRRTSNATLPSSRPQ